MSRPVPPGLRLGIVEPKDAVAAFERRDLLLPSFKWTDVWQQEHLRGFAVAGVMRNDILQLIHDEMGVALQEGGLERDFVKRAGARLQAKGFWGDVPVADPAGGEPRTTRFNDARLRLIFDTNMAVSYAAGQAERFERSRKYFPYLRYVTKRDEHVRESHRPWEGVTLLHDDPWWTLHKPVKAWRCRCTVQQLSENQVARLSKAGKIVTKPPPDRMVSHFDRRTDKMVTLPRGVDPAFAYDMGKRPMRSAVPQLLAKDPYTSKPTTKPALAMPSPRVVSPTLVLPADTEPMAAVDAFLAEFGTVRGTPAPFVDVLGDTLAISEELFLNTAGEWKLVRDRTRYLMLLARAVREPDEVWEGFETHRLRGVEVLRRRYFARFRIEGLDQPMVVVFETGNDGWLGVTTFQSDKAGDDNAQRGTLKRMRNGTRRWVRGDATEPRK